MLQQIEKRSTTFPPADLWDSHVSVLLFFSLPLSFPFSFFSPFLFFPRMSAAAGVEVDEPARQQSQADTARPLSIKLAATDIVVFLVLNGLVLAAAAIVLLIQARWTAWKWCAAPWRGGLHLRCGQRQPSPNTMASHRSCSFLVAPTHQ